MAIAVLLYPILYCWYIALPETLYMLYGGFRSVAYDGPAELYFIGLVVYDGFCIAHPIETMAATAVLIAIDIYLHRGKTIRNAPVTGVTHKYDPLDPFDPANPYNSCPYCGSGDTDGNHCYSCDEDF